MEKVRLKLAAQGQTVFFIADSDGKQLAKLIVDITEGDLIVAALTGKRGSWRKLFNAMISYARENYLKVIAFNGFVYNKLKADPQQFADVWEDSSTYKE